MCKHINDIVCWSLQFVVKRSAHVPQGRENALKRTQADETYHRVWQGVRTRRTCTMTTVSCRQPQRATSELSSGGAENTLSLNMTARPGMRVIGCPVCASYGGAFTTVFLK